MNDVLDILFACAGGARAGIGHVMRCSALAEEARARGLEVAFALRGDAAARAVLRAEAPEVAVVAWRSPRDLARFSRWVVLDAPAELTRAVEAVREAGGRTLVLDRMDCIGIADWTVLPIAHAPPVPHARVLQGAEYCIIARSLHVLRNEVAEPARERVLVTLGGSDPLAITTRVALLVAEALGPAGAARVDVVIGPAFQGGRERARDLEARGFRVHLAPSRAALGRLALRASFAVCGFGTTLYELAFLGVPMLYLAHHPGDLDDATRLEGAGIGANAGFAGALAPADFRGLLGRTALDARWLAARRARGLALLGDGGGAGRILTRLAQEAPVQGLAC